jgi:hypothetical protein
MELGDVAAATTTTTDIINSNLLQSEVAARKDRLHRLPLHLHEEDRLWLQTKLSLNRG